MTIFYKGHKLTQENVYFRGNEVSKLYLGDKLVLQPEIPDDYYPLTKIHLGVIGDSTIAAGYGGLVIAEYEEKLQPFTSVAQGSDTILGQTSKFSALTNTQEFDVVIMQIGLNDMGSTYTLEQTKTQYQNLINKVKSMVKPSCKIYIAKMLPCKARWTHPDVADRFPNPEYPQNKWLALNDAIMTEFTGVDGRIESHVPILDDGEGNLKAEYDTGDHIHETPAGRQVIATAWKDKLVHDGIITA
ncbi:SGNH/GDSL hydrolase family protein [Psychrobacter sp. UBA3962]|uniref:SGNH/GDSL hydrolase family protein n=1 Tax=Psychrobacter sp. UBA3962 TaxID=1947352 RepID=UPI0025D062DB|nr:GDSL-type esterase/lipase family protein [Psychrobacter sp. UBA3962]